MTITAVVSNFEQVAEAPSAGTRLRRFVLALASRGWLVDDSPSTANRHRLRRGGPLSKDAVTHIPLDAVPAHWAWHPLTDLAEVSYGFAFSSSRFNTAKLGQPLVRIRDISNVDTEVYYDGPFDERYRVEPGDYLVGMDGDFNLRCWRGPKALLNQRVMRIRAWCPEAVGAFMAIPLQQVLELLHGTTSLTTVKHLSAKQVKRIMLPVPPVSEQHAIVARVEEWMELCDELSEYQTRRDATRDRLRVASLARLTAPTEDSGKVAEKDVTFFLSHSDGLVTKAEHVADLRRSVLDLAVLGRLRTSNPEEVSVAPAMKTLALPNGYVRRRKIVKRRPSSPTIDVPHANWAIRTVQDLYDCNAVIDFADGNHGSFYPRASEFSDVGVLFVTAKDLDRGRVAWESCAHLSEDRAARLVKGWSEGGDILLTHNATVGRVARVEPDVTRFLLGTSVTYYRLNPAAVSADYFYYYLQSNAWQRQMADIMEQTTRNQVSIQKQADFWVLLPPLPEQHRIVSCVDEVMVVCDELEQALRSAEKERAKLLEAVLHEALNGRAGDPELAEATA